jgi:hypothetical protein
MKTTFRLFIITLLFAPLFYLFAQINDGIKSETVMAVYIYNFTKFLEWSSNDSDLFYISVLGKSNILEPLSKIAEKEKINGKNIVINEIKDLNNLKYGSVLFISTNDGSVLPSILKKTANKNILTVSASKGFADKGVCINFIVAEDKMKFEINQTAIEEAGIIPSTRLLSLALKIYK